MAIIFDQEVLSRHGLELHTTDTGFMLVPSQPIPPEACDLARELGRAMGLDPGDQDRLLEFAADLTCWKSIRAASDASPYPNPERSASHSASRKAKPRTKSESY